MVGERQRSYGGPPEGYLRDGAVAQRGCSWTMISPTELPRVCSSADFILISVVSDTWSTFKLFFTFLWFMGIQLKPLSASARLIGVMIMISFTFGTVARIGTQFGSKVVKNGCVYNKILGNQPLRVGGICFPHTTPTKLFPLPLCWEMRRLRYKNGHEIFLLPPLICKGVCVILS